MIADRVFLFQQLWKKYRYRALVKQFRKSFARPFSRSLLKKFAPQGLGLEIGVGSQTIAPFKRTVLSDAFQSNAQDQSLATEFFPADQIPYPNAHFQFILSEHVLEHVPNPLKVLKEWKRVLKPGGVVFLFMPHPDRTFDQGRPLTTFEHLLQDEKNSSGPEEDFHYEEWVEQVMKKGRAPHYSELSKEECLRTCSLHRHVWTELSLSEHLQKLGFQVLFKASQVSDRSDSFVVVASV